MEKIHESSLLFTLDRNLEKVLITKSGNVYNRIQSISLKENDKFR